jgi:protein-disulfide isomerase
MSQSPKTSAKSVTKLVRPSNRAQAAAQVRNQEQRQHLMVWFGVGLVIALAAASVLYWVTGKDDSGTLAGGPKNAATVVAGPPFASSISVDEMALGDPSAPITVIEYGDYQCESCTTFARTRFSTLLSDYVVAGKIRFEFHQYPLTGSAGDGTFDQDGESFRAAEAALCANDQGLYWPYHNVLYANNVGKDKGSFTPDRLKRLGTMVPGLDSTAFDACVDNRTHTTDVKAQGDEAIANGISSAPTFVINGQPVVGSDYDQIKQAIENQLAGP